jgi:hypothetical protein
VNQLPPKRPPRYEERDIGPPRRRPPRAEKPVNPEQLFYANLVGKLVNIIFRSDAQRASGTLEWSTDHAIGVRLKGDGHDDTQVVLVMKGDIRSISP